MPRKAVAPHKKRDKLCNKLDKQTRAQAQLGAFLAECAEEKKITRGALIEEIALNWARRNGYKPKE